MKKLHFIILKSEIADDHLLWVKACEAMADQVSWKVVDITKSTWLQEVKREPVDGLLANPPDLSNAYKSMYDERVRILHQVCRIPVYPSLEELKIYENKKYLSYWLAANEFPHPTTHVFYDKKEALEFIQTAELPIVGKTNIGASGRGVKIIKTRADLTSYVNDIFSGAGTKRNVGPNWRKKGFLKRVLKKLKDPESFQAKLRQYQHERAEIQKEYVILQAFIPHEFEWRCVRIGDSFFAHKKLLKGEKASGSLLKEYDNPPLALFDFVKKVTDKRKFLSQAVDIFEAPNGDYLINEMQCIFGQSDPYQMLVDGTPGRYKNIGGSWIFEAGDFNQLESFLLRLQHFTQLLQQQQTSPEYHKLT